jgi:hypothetical protein
MRPSVDWNLVSANNHTQPPLVTSQPATLSQGARRPTMLASWGGERVQQAQDGGKQRDPDAPAEWVVPTEDRPRAYEYKQRKKNLCPNGGLIQ